ncbi:hypothetical protein GPA22_08730 [Aromatoleum toluvorans]|uniref:DUF559 domain-containing protein n=1 Tax=Aromatoleum toluvorans TaxID=92002 RepID=A0ABX1PWK0_9RHOO|nr:hypothetical protein [Aromatoleum toluvorans]NMG43814.1 hypothetical protein [Aromatoleum toluvorans]
MPQTGDFGKDINLLVQNVARLFAHEGNAKLVSILSYATISADQTGFDNWDGGTDIYTVYLEVPQAIYLEINAELDAIAKAIQERLGTFLHRYDRTWIGGIAISPQLIESESWQQDARDWLSGEGITNQGRVRSNNIASRQCDGLLFRSVPEINLYRALKSKGLTFAPLPVFLKGGKEYSRIEPDFILIKDGIVFCIEIDGDTVHKETPAEANARTRILSNEGAIVERFTASRCDTPEKAEELAREVLVLIEKHRRNRP